MKQYRVQRQSPFYTNMSSFHLKQSTCGNAASSRAATWQPRPGDDYSVYILVVHFGFVTDGGAKAAGECTAPNPLVRPLSTSPPLSPRHSVETRCRCQLRRAVQACHVVVSLPRSFLCLRRTPRLCITIYVCFHLGVLLFSGSSEIRKKVGKRGRRGGGRWCGVGSHLVVQLISHCVTIGCVQIFGLTLTDCNNIERSTTRAIRDQTATQHFDYQDAIMLFQRQKLGRFSRTVLVVTGYSTLNVNFRLRFAVSRNNVGQISRKKKKKYEKSENRRWCRFGQIRAGGRTCAPKIADPQVEKRARGSSG